MIISCSSAAKLSCTSLMNAFSRFLILRGLAILYRSKKRTYSSIVLESSSENSNNSLDSGTVRNWALFEL